MIQISQALRDLLQQRLTTTNPIEIVLLLRRNPGRSWAAGEVAAELRTAPESAAMRLFLLASSVSCPCDRVAARTPVDVRSGRGFLPRAEHERDPQLHARVRDGASVDAIRNEIDPLTASDEQTDERFESGNESVEVPQGLNYWSGGSYVVAHTGFEPVLPP